MGEENGDWLRGASRQSCCRPSGGDAPGPRVGGQGRGSSCSPGWDSRHSWCTWPEPRWHSLTVPGLTVCPALGRALWTRWPCESSRSPCGRLHDCLSWFELLWPSAIEWWLIKNRRLFLVVLEAGNLTSGDQQGRALVRASSGLQMKWWKRTSYLSSPLVRALIPSTRAPSSWLNYRSTAHLQMPSHWI